MVTSRGIQLTLAALVFAASLAAQGISVTATSPSSAVQGTINLNVTVSGKGFKNGAASRFLITGTPNPGGVVVHTTTFVNSTTVVANIDVTDTAVVSGFDVAVDNPDGHSGKGDDIFSVIAGGANGAAAACVPPPLPAAVQLVATLNPAAGPLYSPYLGKVVRARLTTVLGQSVIMVVAGGGAGGAVEVFFLDPLTGALKDGTWAQPHLTLPVPYSEFFSAIIADVNGDSIPDLIVASRNDGVAGVHLGQGGGASALNFLPPILLTPPPNSGFGAATAVGDLNGDGINEIALGRISVSQGKNVIPGKVFLFRWNGSGFTNYASVTDPEFSNTSNFGISVAIGDVTGDAMPDLVVGSNLTDVGSIGGAGRVWVYPVIGGVVSTPFSFTGTLKDEHFGHVVATANLTGAAGGFSDLLVFNRFSLPVPAGVVFPGPVTATSTRTVLLQPAPIDWPQAGFDLADIDNDQLADVIAASDFAGCTGSASIFQSASGFQGIVIGGPTAPPSNTNPGYGSAASLVPGTRIVLVGDKYLTVNGVKNAGQVYVYKLN